ncbi:zinc-finger of transposase IS204///IS1165 family protein [Burkholderia pseudomallei MSHR3951]|nr:zinc-finger of transposase IS204///IS1165 family protein [Burkholderia pseudomallei MSHR3951]
MNGVVKTWDTSGKMLKEVTYDHGNRIPTAEELAAQATLQQQAAAQLQANTDKQARAEAVSTCVSRHHDEFHKQSGNYTTSPKPEQAAAWEQQCEQSPAASLTTTQSTGQYRLERVEWPQGDSRTLSLYLKPVSQIMYCEQCGARCQQIHETTVRRVRDLPLFEYRVVLHVPRRRV